MLPGHWRNISATAPIVFVGVSCLSYAGQFSLILSQSDFSASRCTPVSGSRFFHDCVGITIVPSEVTVSIRASITACAPPHTYPILFNDVCTMTTSPCFSPISVNPRAISFLHTVIIKFASCFFSFRSSHFSS